MAILKPWGSVFLVWVLFLIYGTHCKVHTFGRKYLHLSATCTNRLFDLHALSFSWLLNVRLLPHAPLLIILSSIFWVTQVDFLVPPKVSRVQVFGITLDCEGIGNHIDVNRLWQWDSGLLHHANRVYNCPLSTFGLHLRLYQYLALRLSMQVSNA